MSLESNSYQKFSQWKELAFWAKPEPPYLVVSKLNPLCGDEVIFYYAMDTKGQIRILGVGGESCSLCSASLGLLYQKSQVWNLDTIDGMVSERKEFLEGNDSHLKLDDWELEFWNQVKIYPNRHRCVLLPWQTLLKIKETTNDPNA
ncbi:iron-sulfur cluster assembly scaffold protein [Leptospira sp. 96542]|nr:iron-sulfur cluster assembly scaffold protein [Leptospira sp. 96542]